MNSVESVLNGFVSIHNGLILYKKYNIIMRQDNKRDSDYNCVKIISGGGSGHEPSQSGYVGYGMLTAAVCGDLFASPSVQAILNAILLTGDKTTSILLIVTNYTGDRINFGLASEIAKCKYGYQNIRTILVNDDCSIDSANVQRSVGKRGLAGSILIHKIVGAMSEMNLSIDEITNYCNNILLDNRLCTIGFTFKSNQNGLEKIELGKGIHGEPGVFHMENCSNFNIIIEKIIEKFQQKILIGSKIIILINNLGGTSEFLLNIFCDIFLEKLKNIFVVQKIYSGTFLTSLNQEGLSVTILKPINDDDLQLLMNYLEFETNVQCNVFGCNRKDKNKLSKSLILENDIFDWNNKEEKLNIEKGLKFHDFGVEFSQLAIKYACNDLISNTDLLNEIDKEFGDGDTGSTLNKGANAILRAVETGNINFEHPKLLLQQISEIIQLNVGGTSGALYSLFFQSASKAFDNKNENNLITWLNALKYGNESIMYYGLAQVGDRTMIDPLKAAEKILEEAVFKELMFIDALELFTTVCVDTADKTINLQPKSGRASYTFAEDSNKICKYPDPGAIAVGLWSKSIYKAGKDTLKKYNL